jgi:fructokinase
VAGALRIGLDLGGTTIEGVLVRGPDDDLEVRERLRVPTGGDRGHEHILQQALSVVEALDRAAGGPVPVGIGMPGSVTREGRVKNSNTTCLNGTFFRRELATRLARPAAFANDANCFALAEARLGAARGARLVFGVILGTGVGGGLVIDGAVREGPQSICGEWGHTVLRPESDRVCYCGQRGCVETHLAGPWVEGDFRRRGGPALGLEEILALRKAGDPPASACIAAWLEDYGRAIANLINVLDPDAVVLGGGVSRADCLYDEGRAMVQRYVFTDELLTPILRHALGDSAGVLGAAMLAGGIAAGAEGREA